MITSLRGRMRHFDFHDGFLIQHDSTAPKTMTNRRDDLLMLLTGTCPKFGSGVF